MQWWQKFALIFVWPVLAWWLAPTPVYAETKLVYTNTVGVELTDWAQTMSFPKFDPTQGILKGIEFALDGTLQASADFESLDAQAITVTVGMGANIELQRPDGSLILRTIPDASVSAFVAGFDGVVDYAGPSGRKFPDLIGIDVAFSEIITTPSDLVLFTGNGLIDLPAVATGVANGRGGGNLAVAYNTSATAAAKVTYIYQDTAIALVKYTNGEDANEAPGVLLAIGDPVTWTYLITNTGEVALTEISLVDDQEGPIACPGTTLAAGASMVCTQVSDTGAVAGQYVNVATVTAKTVPDEVNIQRTVTDTDPSHYFAGQETTCPLNNDGLVNLPELLFLGEGPRRATADPVDFVLPAGYDVFIIKRRTAQGLPFSFDVEQGTLNANGERVYSAIPQKGRNGQRVWACAGECNFIAHLDGEVSVGYLEPGVTIGAVVIDDDTDDRVNYWIGNANGKSETFPIEEQFMVEYLTFTVPYAADWSYFATDSVGIVDLCLSHSPLIFPAARASNGVALAHEDEVTAAEIFLPVVFGSER